MPAPTKIVKPNEATNANKSDAPRTWGLSATEFFAALRNKAIIIVTMDGKLHRGVLVGVDQFDLLVKQASGSTFLLTKHSIKYVQPADVPEGTPSNAQ